MLSRHKQRGSTRQKGSRSRIAAPIFLVSSLTGREFFCCEVPMDERVERVKVYLESYGAYKRRIEAKREEIDTLRALAEYTSRPTDRMTPGAPSAGSISDRVGKRSAEIADILDKMDDDIVCLIKRGHRITQLISTLENSSLFDVVYQKYINGKTTEEIAESLNYSCRHTARLHKTALENLAVTYEAWDKAG